MPNYRTAFFYIQQPAYYKYTPVARANNKRPTKRIPQNFMKFFHEREFMT